MAQTTALQTVKNALGAIEIKKRFEDMLGARAPQFMASITNVVANSNKLQKCDPNSIMAAAFIAASLDLPIDPNLGRAYIVPYGDKAQFQIGYKGFVELAIRTGKYRDMNAVEVYEDEIVSYNPILGKLEFVNDFSKCSQRMSGQKDKIVGYYAYYELLAGFAKGLYMTKEQVIQHAKQYSQSYKAKKMDSPWFTNFDEMAKKTVLKRLLTKFATLSIGEQKAVIEDQKVYDSEGNGEYRDNMEPESEGNELAETVVKELTDKSKDQKKVEETPQVEEIPAMNPPEADFMAFESQFDQETPFK